jgi:hypothetical protein
MEHHSVMKWKELLIHSTTRINLACLRLPQKKTKNIKNQSVRVGRKATVAFEER